MAGKTITIPGAIDLHVHFREPGDNKAETIKSGSRAALQGGYALVCDMPNNPGRPTWSIDRLKEKQGIINKSAYIPVATYAGSQPESDNLAELPVMAERAIGLKLYGAATTGNHIDYQPKDFDKIVETWHRADSHKPIMLHSGKDNLEDFIELIAKHHNHPLHVCHIFSVAHAKIVQRAKDWGLQVTSAVCPHHIFKSTYHTLTEGWFSRMQPPLLHQDEAEELFEMFSRGDIDTLETDHAPHLAEAKWEAEFENPKAIHDVDHKTCFGVPGIEFALPLMFYQMTRSRITLKRIIAATSEIPAKIIGVKLSDKTKVTWRMDHYRIGDEYPKSMSGSGWTPYLNNLAVGKVWQSQVGDKLLVKDGKVVGGLPKVAQRGDTL